MGECGVNGNAAGQGPGGLAGRRGWLSFLDRNGAMGGRHGWDGTVFSPQDFAPMKQSRGLAPLLAPGWHRQT